SLAVYGTDTDCALMVIPRSRSIGLLSSTCASISRSVRPPHSWMMRSASVDLPWSTWAMMEKLRICRIGSDMGRRQRRSSGQPEIIAQGGWPASQPPPAPARRKLLLFRRDRHEPAALAAAHQQHDRIAGLHATQRALELGRAGDRFAADAQDHVARRQARLARGPAFDPGDRHAFL